ncbi:MBL fold metallo-hydrolase [Marispirochaeta sp.]|uniref:MBL fold metallo-hydrolase n=1 Tax=Marispirochaeta sp. TaxID=2038653 RepID=UPI0029C66D42|nr:MBL fold metallo-hydrolase [Marispirochaeta sp.]
MGVQIYSKGAAREVTGSRHYLEVDGTKIQIDCGAFQGRRKEAEEKNRAIPGDMENVSAVVLTHAHFDHSGMLPLLSKGGYKGNIYATPASRDLASLIMMDSAKIQARDIEYLKKKAAKAGQQFDSEVLYEEKDVLEAVNQFVTVSYRRPIYVTPQIELTFYDAGHILGSSTAVLNISADGTSAEPMRIVYAGDLGRKDRVIIRDPDRVPDPDYLIMESTYGDRLHGNTTDAMEKLAEIVSSTAAKNGKIVIPAFAVERTQEIIYYLHLLTDQARIPEIPIFVDSPMATNATSIFRVHPECYDEATNEAFIQHHKNPFGFNNLRYTASVQESKEINDVRGPAIIISADGMCEAGRIRHHLVQHIGDPASTILVVGYMAKHTLGRRIVEGQKKVKIFNETFIRQARVEKIDAFSAHADYSEIRDYVTQLDLERLKKVFLVHGEDDAQTHLQKVLLNAGVKAVEIVDAGRVYKL